MLHLRIFTLAKLIRWVYVVLHVRNSFKIKKKNMWVFCLKASPNCLLSLWILLKMLFHLSFVHSSGTISKLYNLAFQDPNLIFPTSLQHELSFRGFSLLSFKTDFWTLRERERVGWFGRMALKHVYYHVRSKSPVYVRYRMLGAGAQGWSREMIWGGRFRIGNSCTPVADSCQCMAKPIQCCKVK